MTPRRERPESTTGRPEGGGREHSYPGNVIKPAVVTLVLAAMLFAALSSSSLAASTIKLPGIRSPSRNITCLFVPGSGGSRSRLLCAIAHSSYAATLQKRCMGPTGAGVDWHGFDLTPLAKGTITCTGGILYSPSTEHPSYVTLPYGKSWRQGAFTCWSRVTGVTCRNRTGHGLFISRAAWRAW